MILEQNIDLYTNRKYLYCELDYIFNHGINIRIRL